MVRAHRMPDERPLKEQLEDLIMHATHRGMHEAATFIREQSDKCFKIEKTSWPEPEVFGLKKGDRITVKVGKSNRNFKVRCADVSANLVELVTGTNKAYWTLMRHHNKPDVYVLWNIRGTREITSWIKG